MYFLAALVLVCVDVMVMSSALLRCYLMCVVPLGVVVSVMLYPCVFLLLC